MKKPLLFLFPLCLFLLFCCTPKTGSGVQKTVKKEKKPEAVGLNGDKLYIPVDSSAAQVKREENLALAIQQYESDPSNLDNFIWWGRRTAYLWRYKEAIQIYTDGLQKFPSSPELYRHRGHRFISVRQLDQAISDFKRAEQLLKSDNIIIEKDGIPNKLNTPLSNLHFNIYYHWALAHYLKGEFDQAFPIYQKCMNFSINSDLIVATADWMYMCIRRMGKDHLSGQREALRLVTSDMKIIENDSYFQRCMMYKGIKKPEDLLQFNALGQADALDIVTQGYGVGNWYLYNGETEKAKAIFEKIIETGYWSAFGYIAAEAELARME